MRYLFLLSQEHPTLPRAEVEAVLRAEDVPFEVADQLEHLLVVESDDADGIAAAAERLAMTFEVARLEHAVPPDAYQKLAAKDLAAEDSFAVRAVQVDDTAAPDELERNVGRIIDKQSDAGVDLDNPAVLFRVYLVDGTAYVTRLVREIDRSQFEARQNQYRPFSRPVSVHPKLARALVNLSEVDRSGTVLDPFCGTGGILIEAGLIGCDVVGRDVEDEMVAGTVENLNAYDLSGDIATADIADLQDRFDGAVDAIVTDVPYGKASAVDGAPVQALLDAAPELAAGKTVFMSDDDAIGDLEPAFELFVHRSMSRYIYVLD